jgi:sugar lactone lactonase YvrE
MRRSLLPFCTLLAFLVAAVAGCGGGGGGEPASAGAPLRLSGTVSSLAGAATSTVAGTAPVFANPRGVVRVGDFLYVSDTEGRRIRKVSIDTGEVTTLAAGGADGLTTDGTYLYAVSYESRSIFRVSIETGAVTPMEYHTLLVFPDNVYLGTYHLQCRGVTAVGTDLYLADTAGSRILKMSIDNGIVTSLAGPLLTEAGAGDADGAGRAARFRRPGGIATDGTNLYVADTENHTVRKVVIASGEVTTIAGSPRAPGSADGTGSAARFSFPGGVATDGTNLYVADERNHTVRKVVIATGEVTTLAGTAGAFGTVDGTGSAARFNRPCGLDLSGTDLYVADSTNDTIRKVSVVTGEVTTVAGIPGAIGSADGTGGEARFAYPDGIASDGTNLYVADSANRTIRQVVTATGEVSTLAGSAGAYGTADNTGENAWFYGPRGIATDGTNLYVTDGLAIRKVTIATGAVTTFAGDFFQYGTDDGIGRDARFTDPYGITTDGTYLYVADSGNHTIRKVVIATGAVSTLAGTPGLPGFHDCTGVGSTFDGPSGIATDGTNLYVTDMNNHTVRKVAIATGVVTTLAGSPGLGDTVDGVGSEARFCYPSGIATDGTNLYVSDASHTIRKVVIATGEVTTLAGSAWVDDYADGTGSAARFDMPAGLASDGRFLYVADSGNHTIRVIR